MWFSMASRLSIRCSPIYHTWSQGSRTESRNGTAVAHIAIKYYFAADISTDGEINLSCLPTVKMFADCIRQLFLKPACLIQCAVMGKIKIGLGKDSGLELVMALEMAFLCTEMVTEMVTRMSSELQMPLQMPFESKVIWHICFKEIHNVGLASPLLCLLLCLNQMLLLSWRRVELIGSMHIGMPKTIMKLASFVVSAMSYQLTVSQCDMSHYTIQQTLCHICLQTLEYSSTCHCTTCLHKGCLAISSLLS